jgi:hypothetical protein
LSKIRKQSVEVTAREPIPQALGEESEKVADALERIDALSKRRGCKLKAFGRAMVKGGVIPKCGQAAVR